ncbi:cysteine--tRNA ligase [Parachlamydia sp. AcF125]|uniref:cysteine--tRNA ligase n=1 Tax=Parachlamydia sp. AcF125 TaxID=2795736 RepID=UPI001BC8E3AA|nr:cysteine--tRNA ligase [Parachlamydia sp. AcF125]MBS4168675.1 Cysteine--tRNA ligase [Parachlamydia sp. AcF125]
MTPVDTKHLSLNFTNCPIQLFNTERRAKQTLNIENGQIRLYTCGPTVYNFAHIGNFRTYVFEDLLRRTLKFFGLKVKQVMNLTDVDDKTIKGAITKGVTLNAFTQPYKEAFFQDLATLHIEPAEVYPAATDYIQPMIEMIQKLIEKGFAYKGQDGSIYYAIHKFPRYGCLSHLKLDELKVGASERVAADEYDKENISDFVLWKNYDSVRDGQIYWESPFGPGRPGWHLECSAMAMQLLGDTIDIHVGGVDNMFPHHENEIAQSEACSGQTFVKHWMHAEHLVVDGKKMSKSLGNFYTLRDLLKKGYVGVEVRYMLLQTHYKTQLNFTFEGLDAVRHSLRRVQDFIRRIQEIKGTKDSGLVSPVVESTLHAFAKALADDLNISVALAALFEMIREVNTLCDKGQVGESEAAEILLLLQKINQVLAIFSFETPLDLIPPELQDALEQRNQARQAKNWPEADRLRDFIQSHGYIIEDSVKGARLKKINRVD